jgi:hypothetical protein
MWSEIEFRTEGEVTLKTCAPKAVYAEDESSLRWLEERSRPRWGGLYKAIVFERYEGCWRANSLNVSKAVLKFILCFKGNQCKSWRSWNEGVLNVCQFATTLASEFCSLWSLSRRTWNNHTARIICSIMFSWVIITMQYWMSDSIIDIYEK